MAKRRLPDRPPNGIGAGERPKKVPTPIDLHASQTKLSKPFKVPYRSSTVSRSVTNEKISAPNTSSYGRVLRKRTNISYANLDIDIEVNSSTTDQAIDENGKIIISKNRRIDALSARRLTEDPNRLSNINFTLKRSFSVPIKGYIQRHSIPMTLGMKRTVIPEPRPLHDPTDEFAIVLYDPSIDGEMIIKGSNENTTTNNIEESTQNLNNTQRKKTCLHPKFMSNGLRNKSLNELLGDSPFSQSNEKSKTFKNIPVVLDPKLANILRPHQVEGVRFLYRCVTGLVMKDYLESQKVLESSKIVLKEDAPNDELELRLSQQLEQGAVAATQQEEIKQNMKEETRTTKSNKKKNSKKSTKKQNEKKTKNTQGASQVEKVENPEDNRGAYGCIMADEMGLGKTLQCITLMWTLLRQGPQGKRLIDKCIIVCPSSLVNNWANELIKWLGPGTLSPLAIDGKKSSLMSSNSTVSEAIRAWGQAKGRNIVKPVLIISYETLRRNVDQLKNTEVGLMLADEGHRLKNGDSLTFTALDSINCPRRVILSGTPIQNDLSEYFALLNFSNPGLLGTRLEFRKNYEIPILRSRDADATDKEIAKGTQQLTQLSNIVSKFIIRRTNDILSKYLPCKYEHVIFVNLKPFQRELYKRFVKSRDIKKVVNGVNGSQPLKAIGLLKKLCNHPNLLNLEDELNSVMTDDFDIPDDFNMNGNSRTIQTEYSGKFSILERFLHQIKTKSDDKIVLISNYTQTLDLIEKMCRNKHYGVLRLDGTMSINKRQKLVDRFNDPEGQEFIFLLSSKAGGCGINLIGANRLILLDPDWNPAADQQALARVWRDGQKKDCFIYRFISTGTIEEKIFQRQSMKMSLSSCVVDAKEDVERLFSADNLRQLFQLNENTICDTHETYHCKRCSANGKQKIKSKTMLYGDATTWNHLNHDSLEKTNDHLLRSEHDKNDISYVFQYISH
ncbi:hypothetical protein TBLA_0B08040 [Henningerozyma blattae CBS 6284]|uniref:DNA helicase n=1 Tax=Henningerozyma blattae (strain ATCC 34711 / CBS 6284 / DSM 70876 / NBRC 10599 / NRRL Y-10934 / UCD 77-7) TaxID=1071380 RepID=I2GZR8_HENB6|nr:hypothetical protein TBLA_0B08040 [Tetrapisispora blattae CBS 6284]CCH59620.1 hypothetical protein TBLA_0B08040 [Tetrapisispora blattae CBS 6284]